MELVEGYGALADHLQAIFSLRRDDAEDLIAACGGDLEAAARAASLGKGRYKLNCSRELQRSTSVQHPVADTPATSAAATPVQQGSSTQSTPSPASGPGPAPHLSLEQQMLSGAQQAPTCQWAVGDQLMAGTDVSQSHYSHASYQPSFQQSGFSGAHQQAFFDQQWMAAHAYGLPSQAQTAQEILAAEMARLQPHQPSAIQQQQQAWAPSGGWHGLPSNDNASLELQTHLASANDLEEDPIAALGGLQLFLGLHQ